MKCKGCAKNRGAKNRGAKIKGARKFKGIRYDKQTKIEDPGGRHYGRFDVILRALLVEFLIRYCFFLQYTINISVT